LKKTIQYSLFLLILSLIIFGIGLILVSFYNAEILMSDLAWLTFSFYITVMISLFIFLRGQKKDSRNQAFYTFVSVSLKFLIELIIALIWFLIAKKTSISFILLFFVLYLTFTLFSIFVILNTLKNKTL
jgi:hypothetical protein